MSKWEGTHVRNAVEYWRWPQSQKEATLEEVFSGMVDEYDFVEPFPIADHRPRFPTQLDRDIYEHTPDAGDVPMEAHEVQDTCPRHLDPFHLTKRAQCLPSEAIQLADALAILDADSKLSNEVCRWAFTQGVAATLHFLHRFLLGIAEAEYFTPQPECYGEPLIGFQDVRLLNELSVKELRHECKRREIKALSRLTKPELIELLDRHDWQDAQPEDSEPETLAYAPMWEGNFESDWIDSQPAWFQLLIMSIQETSTRDALSAIAAAVHEPELHTKLTGDRASVFWTFYNNRKAYFERKFIIREKAQEMVTRIKAAESKAIGGIGIKLFALQKGQIMGPKLNKREWGVVWAAYFERKAA